MSEFKFACPVCGQHVTCDSANSGSQMECPTCFRKLVVPQAPADESAKFILSAAQVGPQKPITEIAPLPEAAKSASRWWSLVWLGLAGLVAAGAAVAFVKLGGLKISGPAPKQGQTNLAGTSGQKSTPSARAVADPRWRLELADAAIPPTAVSGHILGREFTLGHASVQNGSLSLWQGAKWPPDVGVTILGPKRPPQDYAGKHFLIPTNYSDKTPRIVLRTKDDQQHAVTQNVDGGYALKLEFDAIADGHLPGRIYLCLPDDAKTVVVGSFNAEIRKPNPPKPKPPPLAPPPQTPR